MYKYILIFILTTFSLQSKLVFYDNASSRDNFAISLTTSATIAQPNSRIGGDWRSLTSLTPLSDVCTYYDRASDTLRIGSLAANCSPSAPSAPERILNRAVEATFSAISERYVSVTFNLGISGTFSAIRVQNIFPFIFRIVDNSGNIITELLLNGATSLPAGTKHLTTSGRISNSYTLTSTSSLGEADIALTTNTSRNIEATVDASSLYSSSFPRGKISILIDQTDKRMLSAYLNESLMSPTTPTLISSNMNYVNPSAGNISGIQIISELEGVSSSPIIYLDNIIVAANNSSPLFIASAETQDNNNDGYLDNIQVLFSDPLNVSSVSTNSFLLDLGYNQNSPVANINDPSIINISLTPKEIFDTGARPVVTYIGNSITSMSSYSLSNQNSFESLDRAPIHIVSASYEDNDGNLNITGGDTIFTTYSEPFHVAVNFGDSVGALVDPTFLLQYSGSFMGFLVSRTILDTLDTSRWIFNRYINLTLNSAITTGFGTLVTGASPRETLKDTSFNILQRPTFFTIPLAPTNLTCCNNTYFVDNNYDGNLDELVLEFNEIVSDSLSSNGSISILLTSGSTLNLNLQLNNQEQSILYPSISNDNFLNFSFSTPFTGTAIDEIMQIDLSSIATNIRGLVNQPLSTTTPITVVPAMHDKAPPVIKEVDLQKTESNSLTTITFSEPVAGPPALTTSNIDIHLRLTNNHSWLDNTGNIQSITWTDNNTTLRLGLSVNGGNTPSITLEDAIILSNIFQDTHGNLSTNLVFQLSDGRDFASINELVIAPSIVNYSQVKQIHFKQAPINGKLYIYTIYGKKLYETNIDANGSDISWDLKTTQGRILASGVYYVVVENQDKQRKTYKFVVIQ